MLVHKEFLMKQWRERIEQFLPGAKIGHVQGDVCDFEGKHVVIAMVHSVAQRENYPAALYKWPGMVISDEVHHISSATWNPIPGKFANRYSLGLSATPRRLDGSQNVFFWNIGPILFSAKEQRMRPKIRRVETGFHLVANERLNPALITKPLLLRFLCASTKRNKLIVEQIKLAVKAGRKLLVVSERLEHLRVLEEMVRESWTDGPCPTMGQYVGGMKEEEYEASKVCRVMLATSQLISEGFDDPALDTLFLTTPISDVQQICGRILRPFEGKKDPVVVDFQDDQVGVCQRASGYREKYYAEVC